MNRHFPRFLALLFALASPVMLAADDPPASEKSEKVEYYRQRIRQQRLVVSGRNEACQLVESPLMRFDNPVSRIGDGLLFLWTDRGRPVAIMKSYYNMPNGTWGRTLVSLATRPMDMQVADAPLWSPREPGVTFNAFVGAAAPSDQPGLRLIQMRDLAKQFSVIDNWGIKDPTDWQLRLLPTPLYRYEVAEEGVIDGALFGYVLSGAEALLMLEARQTKEGRQWHYAAARCTRFGLKFHRGETTVAEFPRLDNWPMTQTYFHVAVPMVNYPFGNPFQGDKPNTKRT